MANKPQSVVSKTISSLWVTPKTDWYGNTGADGVYQGDRFNATDFNRIKNNLQYLRNFAITMYPDFDIGDMGSDKGHTDYPYADEINRIEDNLDMIVRSTFKGKYGTKQVFGENGVFIDFVELNRIESVTLDIYNKLLAQHEGRRMLSFMLGPREVFSNGMGTT